VWVMTPPGGVVARLIEPARLRPYSSMPPWRGEPMTGTRARAAHSQRLLAMELPPTPQPSTRTEAQQLRHRSLSASILHQP
jgi:hypothetical protein